MKKQTNALVGSTVLIDWPIRWKHSRPDMSDQLRATAEREEEHFGRTGTIVAYNPGDERGRDLKVRLENGELVDLYQGAVTVTALPPDGDARIVELLEAILKAVQK